MRGKTILITGGAGFIGSHLASHFSTHNMVTVLDDLSSGSRDNLKGLELKFVRGSILNRRLVKRLCKGADFVFHLAAMASVQSSIADPERCFRVNVGGSLNLLKAAVEGKVKKFIFSSSAAVYGESPELPKRETMLPVPISPYAASKLAVEHQCIVYNRLYGLPFVCLRLFNVYGPKQDPKSQYSGVISKFIAAALARQQLIVFGDGLQTRDFVYVGDVVNSFEAAIRDGNGIFNIASGATTTINSLASVLVRITHSSSIIIHKPCKPGDIMHSRASIRKAVSKLKWLPRMQLARGLAETVAWQNQKV